MSRRNNTYFSFKQFRIEQDQCAMKVCTDACILGAYVNVQEAQRILDIGTGTGVLALMMAQRTNAKIDAVEIDESAYNQAVMNVDKSDFRDKIKVYKSKIQDFNPLPPKGGYIENFLPCVGGVTNAKSILQGAGGYDLIISNPPFYQNSLQSLDNQANMALHAVELTFEELLEAVARLLKDDGKFMVLLPPFETERLKTLAAKIGLFVNHQLYLQHDNFKPIFRTITTFSRKQMPDYQRVTLVIWAEDGKHYSDDFRKLLQDYYTIF